MYKNLERYFKENSPYNKIKIKTIILYVVVTFLLLVCNYYENIAFMIIILILLFYKYKGICEKTLETKLYFKYDKRAKSGLSLDEIISNKEKNIIIKYLKENNLYNKDSINCILNHYRCNKSVEIIGGNFLGILTLIISVALAFVTKDGFAFKNFVSSVPYFIALLVLVWVFYFAFNKAVGLRKILKGEEDIFERLEVIFSELYVEYKQESIFDRIKLKIFEIIKDCN